MAAYVIVDVDTSDPQIYEDYKRMAQEAVAQYGGRYLARGGKMQLLEGGWKPTRLVILEFPSFERARDWWDSEVYGPAKELRQSISRTDMVLLDGYTP